MLEETGELAQAVTGILTGAQGAGVDPRAVTSLTAALQTLDPGASTGYAAGSRKDRHDGSGYGSDGEFLEALSDAEEQVREHLREVKALREQAAAGPGPRTAGPRAGPPRPRGGQRGPGRCLRHEHQGAVRRLPRSPRRRDRSRRGRRRRGRSPDRGRRNAGPASARPPPTSSTLSPSDWPGRWPGCGQCPRTSARSTSWSMSSSVPGGNCRGTAAGSKGPARRSPPDTDRSQALTESGASGSSRASPAGAPRHPIVAQ